MKLVFISHEHTNPYNWQTKKKREQNSTRSTLLFSYTQNIEFVCISFFLKCTHNEMDLMKPRFFEHSFSLVELFTVHISFFHHQRQTHWPMAIFYSSRFMHHSFHFIKSIFIIVMNLQQLLAFTCAHQIFFFLAFTVYPYVSISPKPFALSLLSLFYML